MRATLEAPAASSSTLSPGSGTLRPRPGSLTTTLPMAISSGKLVTTVSAAAAGSAASKESNINARGWANVLAGVPLFAELNRRHLNKVAALGRISRFYDGTAIMRAGDAGDALYVVLDGEVSVKR